jgi:hypothetical protein
MDTLPSNAIVYKLLTNIGATTLELLAKHHSIVIEPNVPVILGKQSKEIFGVSEGVYKEDVVDYLYSNVQYKKIMVTPESFSKVKDAIEQVGMNMYEDFSIVFDECERTIQDVSYRADIILPMNDFFLFKRKTFISATPLPPSDPRFKQYKFTEFYIKPDFDTTININLIPTNNILLSLRRYLKDNPSEHYCIFLNSTETIASIIKTLEIKDESHIFCAKESVSKLKMNDLRIATAQFDKRRMKKYNFFSSRFNSAVDLKVDFKPNILILTDLQKALHSMVDPSTEVVQIIGRWRNGINNVTHITNLKANLTSKTQDQVLNYLEGCESAYNTIKGLRHSATTEGARETLDQCLKLISYAKYINTLDESKNYYMIDNEMHLHRVNGYYQNNENIRSGYLNAERFNVNYLPDEYPLDDIKNNQLLQGISRNRIYQYVAELLRQIEQPQNVFNFNAYVVRGELNKLHPQACAAYQNIGYNRMAELNFRASAIDREVELKLINNDKSHFMLIRILKHKFKVNHSYSAYKINRTLQYIIKKYGLRLKPNLQLFTNYFELSTRTTIGKTMDDKEVKGYRILKCKFN